MELKISWLSELDHRVFLEILISHEDCPVDNFKAYEDNAASLLIPEPFARDIYCYFLQSRMDFENGETGRYNQSAALFNDSFEAYRSHYNRNHLPLSQGAFKRKGEEKCQGCPF